MKIKWITTVSQSYGPNVIQGGMTYDYLAIQALGELYEIETVYVQKNQKGNIISRFLNEYNFVNDLARLQLNCDVTIRTHFPVAHTPYKKHVKNVAIIHQFYKRPTFDGYYVPFFFNNLKKLDTIVTVSKFWQSWFLKKGCRNVQIIYNPFKLNDYIFSDDEINAFKKKFNLVDRKPIIYMGSVGKGKGVEKTYEALKDIDATLVCSGVTNANFQIPHLKLNHREYLYLLKSSQIVVQMSELNEGWCRVLHEAMLCKTPAIGSGRGGMAELLSGGKQFICKNFKELRAIVVKLINDNPLRKELGEKGYEFAKLFPYERFKSDWIQIVGKILEK